MNDYDTRAALSALSSGLPTRAWVGEVKAVYVYASGSSATVNGWTVLTSAAGGRWLIDSSSLMLPIIGGGSDDWVNMAAASAATAAAGIKLRFGAGEYQAKTRQFIASNSNIVMSPLTNIKAAITNVDNRDSPICGFGTSSSSDTLAANTNIGDDTVTLTTGLTLSAGDFIELEILQYRVAIYQVTAYNSGTKVVTLDRPLRMAYTNVDRAVTSFPSGSRVLKLAPVQNVRIDFNGAHIYGACNRFIEFIVAWKCHLIGPVYCGDGTSTTATDRIISIDCPSYDCHVSHLIGDGGGTTLLGLSFEAAEGCSYDYCEIRRTQDGGVIFQDGVDSILREPKIHEIGGPGIVFTAAADNSPPTGSGSVFGSDHCRVIGGNVSKCGSEGVLFERGSSRCVAENVMVLSCAEGVKDDLGWNNVLKGGAIRRCSNGIRVSGNSTRFSAMPDTVTENTNGVIVDTGAVTPFFDCRNMGNNSNAAVITSASLRIGRVDAVGPSSGNAVQVAVQTGGAVLADVLNLSSGSGSDATIQLADGSSLEVRAGNIAQSSGKTGINCAGTAALRVGPMVSITGHGAGGNGIVLLNTSTAEVCAGAVIENNSVNCATGGNSTATLNALANSKHYAA